MNRDSGDDDTEILGTKAPAPADEETVIDTPTADGTEVAGTQPRGEANVLGRGGRLETQKVRVGRRVPVGVMVTVTLFACVTVAAVYYLHRDPEDPVAATSADTLSVQAQAVALVDSALAAGDIETLPARLIALLGPDPESEQLSRLLHDATRLADMYSLLQLGQLHRVAEIRASGPLGSASLEQAAVAEIDPVLGPPDRQKVLAAAATAWGQGELIEALNGLKPLARQQDAAADALLQRYSRVVEAYDDIRKTGVENVAGQTLLLFYLDLDPVEDAFFWRNMEADLLARNDAAKDQAVVWLKQAGQRWVHYREQGGIDGALRQQPDSGAGFREQAQALHDAKNSLARVLASASMGQDPAEVRALRFPALVDLELAHQIRCLEILLRYSDDALWQSRLDMLPRT